MTAIEHKIPPPVVALTVGWVMWLVAGETSLVPVDPALRLVVANIFAFAGLFIAGAGMVSFRRAKTTINPLTPDAASSLVVSGIYRYTRNPMYVGLAAVLVGWAVHLSAPWSFLGPVVFVLFISRFQIMPEERALAKNFGPEFAEYSARVRRWL